jgi:hypothetical protein
MLILLACPLSARSEQPDARPAYALKQDLQSLANASE